MLERLSILLVTADRAVKQWINALEDEQLSFVFADDCTEAIATLKHRLIDVIVSDTAIGQLDGWRLARMVRAGLFKCKSSTPFILLTTTYCERIAETTASAFAIDKVIAKDKLEDLSHFLTERTLHSAPKSYVKSVLVVEDDTDIAVLTQRILQAAYTVDTAPTGKQGLEKYTNNHYDIVLLDVQLPEMSGPQVLEQIMRINPDQAVVIMTAHGGTDLAEQLMIQGAVDFVTKPFKAEQLRKVISIAAHRENYLVSNEQFEEKVLAIKRGEEQFSLLTQSHQRLLEHISTVIMELDLEGQIVFTNQAWERLSGYSIEESVGKHLHSFAHDETEQYRTLVTQHIDTIVNTDTSSTELECQLAVKSLPACWVSVAFDSIQKNGETVGITASIDNINDRKTAEIELAYLATHDTLTDLFNRHYFDEQLHVLYESSVFQHEVHALLYLDLDHFKVINDTQGHHQGDAVLKEVASHLKGFQRKDDIICRIGGDEFGILLPNTSSEQAAFFARNICEALQQQHYHFGERTHRISGSIGIAEINGSESKPDRYLQHADIALYVAKGKGRNAVHVFSKKDKASEDFQMSVNWMHTVRQAISRGDLLLHFQPVIHAKDRSVAYYEALVRLNIDNKLTMPGEFIPALERAQDIKMLDHQVIDTTMSMMSVHERLHKVAINLSAQAFSDEDLLRLVEAKLKEYNISPQRIIFEVTESASLTNIAATQSMIRALMELGCEFSIDDFGTGFSTFNYLKQLPANCVKIDGSFVKDMLNNSIDMALVKSICEIAKALGKTTVAEFVENEAILQALLHMDVDYLQGYHISRPKEIEKLNQDFF